MIEIITTIPYPAAVGVSMTICQPTLIPPSLRRITRTECTRTAVTPFRAASQREGRSRK